MVARRAHACRIRKDTNTHSEYVLLIVFRRQQWSHEGRMRAGYVRIQTYTLNTYYLLFFDGNTGCTKAPQCYVIEHCVSYIHVYLDNKEI
jgi:hypothetical protein